MQHIRFIHCADLHLDSRMETHLNRFQAQNRREELLRTFSRMADYAVSNQVQSILIAGDLFDSIHPSAASMETVLHCIQEHPMVDFLYLPGNHDEQIAARFTALDTWPDNLWILSAETDSFRYQHRIITQKKYGNVIITGLPDYASASFTIPSLSADAINLVMFHGQLDDTLLKKLSGHSIDYLAAGHIHRYQEGILDSRGYYCYCGCLEGRGFDECGEKGFVLLDVSDENEKPGVPRITWKFVPFAYRQFYELNLDVSHLLDYTNLEQQVGALLQDIESNHMVHLHLTGHIPAEHDLHIDWLLQKYLDDFYLLKIENDTQPIIHYEDYQYDISLKGEFIRLVLSSSELTQKEKEQIITEGLWTLSGKERSL